MSGFRWLADQFFQLPRWERLGNIAMVTIVLGSVLAFSNWPVSEITAKEKKQLQSLQLALDQKQEYALAEEKEREKQFVAGQKSEVDTFHLADINKASYDDLLRCGLSKYVSRNIIRYTEKGGRIETIDDARKLYGMTPGMLERLLTHTQLDSVKIKPEKKFAKKEAVMVDLNTADSVQLVTVNGIGGKTAQRILSFRKQVGLFHNLSQLDEIRGIYPETLESMKKQLIVQGFAPFIHINSISENDLFQHMYFRKDKLSKTLVAYRNMHGKFKGPEDLKKCKLVTDEIFQRIIPYIIFD